MGFLIAGLVLWWAAHLFKRALPAQRAALSERIGDGAKGVVALLLVVAVAMMVIGHKRTDFTPIYDPPIWGVHVNNLLMLIAVALFGAGMSKGRARSWFRHPMLMGTATWAIAHLLANGDLSSLILFGGLLAWALAEMVVINAAEGPWQRPEPGPASGDIKLAVITVVVFAVIAGIHAWIGPWPFPG